MNSKIKVALLDSGIDMNHERLYNKPITAINLQEDGNSFKVSNSIEDAYGHGTALAGIIYEHVPQMELLSIRVLNEKLKSTTTLLIKAIEIAIEAKVHIINLSLGLVTNENIEQLHKVCNKALEEGIFIISAYNNEGLDSYPAAFLNVFGIKSEFTLRKNGYRVDKNTLDVFANGCYQKVLWKENSYRYVKGNSYACAHFTGILAKLLMEYPEVAGDVKTLKNILKLNSLDAKHTFIKKKEEINNEKIIFFPVVQKYLNEFQQDIDYFKERVVGLYDFRKFQYDFYELKNKENSYSLKVYDDLEDALSGADSLYIADVEFIPCKERKILIEELIIRALKLKKNVYLETQEIIDNFQGFLSLAKENGVEILIYRL